MLSLRFFSQLILIGTFQSGDAVYCGQLLTSSQRKQFPYMVVVADSIGDDTYYCAGAIIDARHVLTAAHCVYLSMKEQLTIIAGVVNRESMNSERSGVASIHIPKEFEVYGFRCGTWNRIHGWLLKAWEYVTDEVNHCLVQNDIAVLTLSTILTFNENIKAINLPDSNELPHCQLLTFASWGQTKRGGPVSTHLSWTYMMITETPNNTRSSLSEFWVIDPILETCSLKGDSGAPLVFNNTVYGVDSHGSGDPARPAAFAKVFAHIKFIREILGN